MARKKKRSNPDRLIAEWRNRNRRTVGLLYHNEDGSFSFRGDSSGGVFYGTWTEAIKWGWGHVKRGGHKSALLYEPPPTTDPDNGLLRGNSGRRKNPRAMKVFGFNDGHRTWAVAATTKKEAVRLIEAAGVGKISAYMALNHMWELGGAGADLAEAEPGAVFVRAGLIEEWKRAGRSNPGRKKKRKNPPDREPIKLRFYEPVGGWPGCAHEAEALRLKDEALRLAEIAENPRGERGQIPNAKQAAQIRREFSESARWHANKTRAVADRCMREHGGSRKNPNGIEALSWPSPSYPHKGTKGNFKKLVAEMGGDLEVIAYPDNLGRPLPASLRDLPDGRYLVYGGTHNPNVAPAKWYANLTVSSGAFRVNSGKRAGRRKNASGKVHPDDLHNRLEDIIQDAYHAAMESGDQRMADDVGGVIAAHQYRGALDAINVINDLLKHYRIQDVRTKSFLQAYVRLYEEVMGRGNPGRKERRGNPLPKPTEWTKGRPYHKEVASLLNTLRKHGIKVIAVYDGEGSDKPEKAHPANVILSVDESWIRVLTPGGKKKTLYAILGNGPGELIADYHVDPHIDAAMREHWDRWT